MGMYINRTSTGKLLPAFNKANELCAAGDAMVIAEPKEWDEEIVCVVENGMFEAAAYCYSPDELEAFRWSPSDPRPRTWLRCPNAKKLAG